MPTPDQDLVGEIAQLRKTLYAGFILIATELDMSRNVSTPKYSIATAEDNAIDLMRKITEFVRQLP